MGKKNIKNTISFIIPNYNTPINDLKRCIDSIYVQNTNDEIILVDDFSKNCNEVEKLCKSYKNLILIRNPKNLGVSASRNIAIKAATGKWIAFVDADDEIVEGSIAQIKNAPVFLSDQEIDVIACGVYIRNRESTREEYYYNDQSISELRKEVLMQKSKSPKNTRHIGVTWGKLYRKTFLLNNNILFPDNISRAEDNIFFLDVLSNSPNVKGLKTILYRYINNSYSVTKRFTPNLFNQFDATLRELEKRAIGREEKELVIYRRSKYILNAINNLFNENNREKHKEIINQISEIVEKNENRQSLLFVYNKTGSLKKRLALFLIIHKQYSLLYALKRFKK